MIVLAARMRKYLSNLLVCIFFSTVFRRGRNDDSFFKNTQMFPFPISTLFHLNFQFLSSFFFLSSVVSKLFRVYMPLLSTDLSM